MKLSTGCCSLLLLSLPLVGCQTMDGWFGNTDAPRNYGNYNNAPQYGTTAVTTGQAGYQQGAARSSDTTAVDHGASTVSMPSTSTGTAKTNAVSQEKPMVTGGAPKVE